MACPKDYISYSMVIVKVTPTLRVRSKVWLLEAQDPKVVLLSFILDQTLKGTLIALFTAQSLP